jgi:hypothetical protein
MADDKRSTSGERRRRPAPTIDLPATEVKPADAPPPQEEEKKEQEEKEHKTEIPEPGTTSGSKRPIAFAVVAGIVAGAAAVLGTLWLMGTLPLARPSEDVAPRVAALEAQLNTIEKNTGNAATLAGRIDKLEQTVTNLPAVSADPASGERLTAIESALKALGVTLAALNRRAEESATAGTAARQHADAAAKAVAALEARLAAMERSTKATQDKVAQDSGADLVARRALAAVALRDAVARGVPYAAELAIVKQLGTDAQPLAALEPFAQSGIPSEAELGRQMSTLLPKMVEARGADASRTGGFFERLQANASKLVREQPIGEPEGDDPSAVLARIEVKAAHHDLAGIQAELAKLPPDIRAPAEPWTGKLAARDAALAAARKLAADSAAALGAR